MHYSRRRFLNHSAVLASLAGFLPGKILAQSPLEKRNDATGLATGQPIPLAYPEIPGFLSAAQLKVHHDKHYVGALKGYRSLDEALHGAPLDPALYTTKSRARTHKANSVFLHELYFSGLTARATLPDEALRTAIQQRFGTIERWWEDFQAAAKSSRGWALLVYQPLSGKLYNIISDNHGNGVLWQAIPILALDMFEHAYYLDYQNDKGTYIERFINHIDGQEVSRRYQQARQLSF